MKKRISLIAFLAALACTAPGDLTAPTPDATGPCFGRVLEDTLYVTTSKPLGGLPPLETKTFAIDTVVHRTWIQVCLP